MNRKVISIDNNIAENFPAIIRGLIYILKSQAADNGLALSTNYLESFYRMSIYNQTASIKNKSLIRDKWIELKNGIEVVGLRINLHKSFNNSELDL